MQAKIVANNDNLNLLFEQLKDGLINTKPLMAEITDLMDKAITDNFVTSGSRIGKQWDEPAWNPKGTPPLGGTGGSIFDSKSTEFTDSEAIIGFNHPGAAPQNFGGRIYAKKKLGSVKRKKDVWAMEQYFWSQYYQYEKEPLFKFMAFKVANKGYIDVPARPYLELNQQDYQDIEDAVVRFMQK